MKKTFKVVAFLEGLSYLLLLFVGVPLKYFANNEIVVKSLGMPHGILFMAYIILALLIKDEMKWNLKVLSIVFVCSILPFGTFWVDRTYLK